MVTPGTGAAAIEYRLLGPFEVLVDGSPVRFGGVKQRAVLAMLALDPNHGVTTGRLIEGLWGDDPPDRPLATVQVYVSGLRKALPGSDGASPIVTRSGSYVLSAEPSTVDVLRLGAALEAGREALRWQDDESALAHFERALALWRGEPLTDFAGLPFATGPAAALDQQRREAVAARADILLRAGRHDEVTADLEDAVNADPLDEGLARALAVAQYRCGRQADALATLRRCRDGLLEELGVDPSPETRSLELALLEHDPSLATPPARQPVRRGDATVPARAIGPLVLLVAGGDRREFTTTATIGRAETCDVVVDDAHVSREHAEIRRDATGWTLVDQSLNGTFVNGEPCSRRALTDGDLISIGPAELRVESA